MQSRGAHQPVRARLLAVLVACLLALQCGGNEPGASSSGAGPDNATLGVVNFG